MNLLVTGGAGFIGSNFIRYWLKKYPKDKITNLDKLTYAGHLSSTKDFSSNKNYKFIKGDITNSKLVGEITMGIDLIVHFAAESHVDRSVVDPHVFVKTNVLGTHVLLNSALKNNIKHFHHVSTDEVFGALPLDPTKKFTEKTPYDPRSPYSAAKAGSDHLVRSYFHTFKLPITITNCANNYGPYHDPEKLFPRFITNLIDDQPVTLYGDGKYVRDWLHVEDHISAIETVIKKGEIGETYLVGSTVEEVNNLKIAKKLIKIFGKDEKKYIKFVKDRAGHDRRYAIDWSKLKRLGWKPVYSDLDQGVKETVDWYRNNEWWWRPIKKISEKFYREAASYAYEKTGQE